MERTVKLIVIGDPSVGKTSFIARYIKHMFKPDYKATIGVDFSLKTIKWSDDLTLRVQFWDIAGQDRFTNLTRIYYQQSDACILMFDLTRETTFNNVHKWKKDLDSKCQMPDGAPIPCILLGNKCDLRGPKIQKKEIEAMSEALGCFASYQVSVLENDMIQECMKSLLKEVVSTHMKFHQKSIASSKEVQGIKLQRNEETDSTCVCSE